MTKQMVRPDATHQGITDEDLGIFRPGNDSPAPEWADPDHYPRLFSVSAGHIRPRIVCPLEPQPVEYVTVPRPLCGTPEGQLAIAQWNMLWESAQYRRRYFDSDELPPRMRAVAEAGDLNISFVPRSRSRYFEYEALYHLLPRSIVERHGLPLVRAGQWPLLIADTLVEERLPDDFAVRLARAWADLIWRDLMPGSPMSGFSSNDPIRILSHNLDFWIPPVTEVIQEILWDLPTGESDDTLNGQPVQLEDGSILPGAVAAVPRVGSELWQGDRDARWTASWVVERADEGGRLRAVLDTVRSHRAEDDFSERWTNARIDFERKLHRTRNKVKVTFVELNDTVCVQGPETEVVGNAATSDFMALLNLRQREIVVLLSSGHTNLTEVGQILGYSNHSAVSKQLAKIRQLASEIFDNS